MSKDSLDLGKGSGSDILAAPASDVDAISPDKLRSYLYDPEAKIFGHGVGQSASGLPDLQNHMYITLTPFYPPVETRDERLGVKPNLAGSDIPDDLLPARELLERNEDIHQPRHFGKGMAVIGADNSTIITFPDNKLEPEHYERTGVIPNLGGSDTDDALAKAIELLKNRQ